MICWNKYRSRNGRHVCSNSLTVLLPKAYRFSLHHLCHFPHICVSLAVDGAAMDVVAKVGVDHDKDANVAHRAQVHELLDLVLHKTLIDECKEDPLHHR